MLPERIDKKRKEFNAAVGAPGVLDAKTKELIAYSASLLLRCRA